ncbi:growth hormone secretagogue receptor type 1-like [Limanda limanda]|uniref:growth hormone secretagogue receptor type 1-like n=1 Tax=Limanda limanda TaxID=27771 RepID=UPI0029C94B5F|nr:growth hormone secretagogue receptor type 1-like [Limanda limanda]
MELNPELAIITIISPVGGHCCSTFLLHFLATPSSSFSVSLSSSSQPPSSYSSVPQLEYSCCSFTSSVSARLFFSSLSFAVSAARQSMEARHLTISLSVGCDRASLESHQCASVLWNLGRHGSNGGGNVSCGVKNCSTPGFWRNCSNQDWSLTVILVLLIIFGLVGNTLTLLVFWLRPNMRSSTYLYLSSMAVSDLLTLLLQPLDLYMIWKGWKLGVSFCKLTHFLSVFCTFCTILHITFLSLERYLVVCWPITSKTLVTRRRTRALIGCLWLVAAVTAAPVPVVVVVEYFKIVDHMGREVDYEGCGVSQSSFSSGLMLTILILYNLYVLVPLCILGLVFILIGRTLRLRPQSSRKDKSHRHTIKMLGVIFLAFVLCWLPDIVSLTMIYCSLTAGSSSTDTLCVASCTHNVGLTPSH